MNKDNLKKEWYEKTYNLAANTSIPTTQIANDTGLNRKWVERFIAGKGENSQISYVNTLFDYLKRRK